jgi:hypothetical protein
VCGARTVGNVGSELWTFVAPKAGDPWFMVVTRPTRGLLVRYEVTRGGLLRSQ